MVVLKVHVDWSLGGLGITIIVKRAKEAVDFQLYNCLGTDAIENGDWWPCGVSASMAFRRGRSVLRFWGLYDRACFSTAWCTFFLLPGFDICFTREGEMVDGPGTTLLYANTLPSHEQQAWQIAQAHVSSYHGVATGVTRAASMIGGE